MGVNQVAKSEENGVVHWQTNGILCYHALLLLLLASNALQSDTRVAGQGKIGSSVLAQSDPENGFNLVSHNVGLCLGKHTQNNDGSSSLLVGDILMMAVDLPEFLDDFVRDGNVVLTVVIVVIGDRIRDNNSEKLLQ